MKDTTEKQSAKPSCTPDVEQQQVVYHEHPCFRLLSFRNVFVTLSLATVIAMASCLITLSYQAQSNIANNLGDKIQEQLDEIIVEHGLGDAFEWVETQLLLSKNFFYNKVLPPNGTNIVKEWADVAEYMWTAALQQKMGTESGIYFVDGRFFGFDNFGEEHELYMLDWCNDTCTGMLFNAYEINASLPISEVNYSTDLLFSIPISSPTELSPVPTFSSTCNAARWHDLVFIPDGYEYRTLVSASIAACNKYNEMMGYFTFAYNVSSLNILLDFITNQYAGKIFLMDSQFQLVSSSTNTPVFTVNGTTVTRQTVHTTSETWIKQVFAKFSSYEDQFTTVHINNTKFLLSLTVWNNYPGIDWYIVKLLDYDQFLGEVDVSIKKSIAATTAIAASAVVLVLLVTYVATKPLTQLAKDMQRISRLEFDSTMFTVVPKLQFLELKRLHHSFTGMNVALRSFHKFVPREIIAGIISSKKEVVADLQFANITIMFQDIENFTHLSETLEPINLAKLTSEYMDVMTTIIVKHGGTIDKYIGDCVMSLFNAPQEVADHAVEATTAATECLLALMSKNKEWKEKYGVEMSCRTGIHTGQVLLGNMGSNNRLNYTAFGDNVNIAARLEGVNKLFGTRIIVSKDVRKSFPPDKFVMRKLGKYKVSGKAVATTIYEVRENLLPTTPQLFQYYEAALGCFKRRNFAEALSQIEQAIAVDPGDKASRHLLHRIEAATCTPLPPTWSYSEKLSKY